MADARGTGLRIFKSLAKPLLLSPAKAVLLSKGQALCDTRHCPLVPGMPRSWLTFPHRDSPIHFRARVLGGLGGRDQVKEQPRVGDAPYREATWGAWLQTPQAIFRASIWWVPCYSLGFPGDPDDKESSCNVEDLGLIPGLGRSPGGEHSNPFQYSYLENPHGQRSLAIC